METLEWFAREGAWQFLTMDSRFWLSPHADWDAVRAPGPNNALKPLPRHFLNVAWITGILLLARFLFERFIALPIGRYFKVPDRIHRPPTENKVLEKAYKRNRKPSHKDIVGLAKDVDWTERKVERWFYQKRSINVPTAMTKFREGLWRLFCYVSLLVMGFIIIPKKPYWKVTNECWTDYPHKGIDLDIFWYYMVELSFYASLSISQFFDIKRKDFWEMLIHHVATILLISFSFITNYVAIGSLIMFVHDWADPWLEFAKLVGYTRQRKVEGRTAKQTFGDFLFITFMLTFWYSRVYFFPANCIYCSWVEMQAALGPEMWPMHRVFNGLLITLWVLHIFWSVQIVKVLVKSIMAGGVQGDCRSDDEADETESPDSPVTTTPVELRANGKNHVH